jgi:hypothetical protein
MAEVKPKLGIKVMMTCLMLTSVEVISNNDGMTGRISMY